MMASVRALTSIAQVPTQHILHRAIIHATRNVQTETFASLWVWLIGVANTKATIVALVASVIRFLAPPSQFFAVFDSLATVIACLSP